jgi:hypothetical protein
MKPGCLSGSISGPRANTTTARLPSFTEDAMSQIITLTASDGSTVQFVDEKKAAG